MTSPAPEQGIQQDPAIGPGGDHGAGREESLDHHYQDDLHYDDEDAHTNPRKRLRQEENGT